MLQFRKTVGIYRQIADYGLDQVLTGGWSPEQRVPSVRSLAAEVGVTPNTVMRAYRDLEDLGILETKRGLGFFVADAGARVARQERRRQFIQTQLPQLRATLDSLAISPQELLELLSSPTSEQPLSDEQ